MGSVIMLLILGLTFVFCGFTVAGETASSLEELKDGFMSIVVQCIKENSVTEEQIKAIREGDITDNPTFKCLFACAYKKSGMASSLEELKDGFMSIVVQCIKENSVTEEQIKAIREGDITDNPTFKCLFACAYKKSGMMDDKGFLSIEGVRKISEEHISEDPDILKKTDQYIEACKSVNDVPVSDGDKGCERAALLYKCSMEKASDIGF